MGETKQGIAIAGNLIVDQIKYVDRYPSPQTLAAISRMELSIGGLACNCGLTLAKLDPRLPLTVIGVLGEDEMARHVLERFARHANIDCSRIRRAGHTSYTDVMTTPDGGRTFFTYSGSNALLTPDDFDFTNLDARLLHVGYILLLEGLDQGDPDYPTAMCRVLDGARQAGIATSVDVISEDSDRYRKLVVPALPYTDYLSINEIEAERTTGVPLRDAKGELIAANLRAACERLLELGVGRWAVIHSQYLSGGMDAEGNYVEEASWPIPPGFKKSSVGAGDAFTSGLLYAIWRGWDLARAIHVAGAVAAWSLSGAGGADAILPLDELLARMRAFREQA
ncbi:MAG: carbohydrate kinase family protein [Bacillota bacterium]|nr:carbohydrate kinase family protein [Bacillota bacterium]